MTQPDPGSSLHGEISRCECGAESPPDVPDALDHWEDDHVQWDCPVDTSPQWDDALGWRYPRMQVITRSPAPITPWPTTPATPRDRRTRIQATRDYLEQHTQEATS